MLRGFLSAAQLRVESFEIVTRSASRRHRLRERARGTIQHLCHSGGAARGPHIRIEWRHARAKACRSSRRTYLVRQRARLIEKIHHVLTIFELHRSIPSTIDVLLVRWYAIVRRPGIDNASRAANAAV